MARPKPEQPALPRRAAYVRWLDAAQRADSQLIAETIKELGKGFIMDAIGWVLTDDDSGVLLCMDMNCKDDSARHALFIPRGMILSLADLGVVQ